MFNADDAKSIFLAAVEMPPADRASFLKVASAGNTALHERVEALLKAHENPDSFLDSPAAHFGTADDLPFDWPPAAKPGVTMIGPYKLLEPIGEGGMGLVFLAEQQEPVRRHVALKIIKPGMDTRQVIARFEAERQALALMDHSNIARVLDAGATDAGRPYFVMELARGVPITEYCDENALTVRARLELFVQVCNAVQHAHQKGIIHRDLKPSNVLVSLDERRPAPKVIDFGVAKAIHQQLTEKTVFTNFAQLIGTPLYMSPEQAETPGQDVDTRSDIYSLGVMLYELLTGTTPFDMKRLGEATLEEIRRIVREEEPPRPSMRIGSLGDSGKDIASRRLVDPGRLSQIVSGDLDWIVMKALERERNRRYETADGLARDIQRYLADEPVEACPPSTAYRVRKFARRNRLALLTAMLVTAALVLGTAISSWQAIRAMRAEHLAELDREAAAEQRTEADKQRARAEANFQQARKTVDEYFTLVSESKLFDVPGLQPLRADLLEAALRFYQELGDRRSNDPAVLADLAATFLRVAVVYHTMDRNDDAVAALDKGLAIVDQLRREHPGATEQHRKLAGFWKDWRRVQADTQLPRDPAAAFQGLQKLIASWKQFAEANPETLGFQSDLAATYYLVADLLISSGKRHEGLAYLEESRVAWDKLVRGNPEAPELRANLARSCEDLAWRLSDSADSQRADGLLRQTLTLRDQLATDFPDVPQYRLDLAESLKTAGDRAARGRRFQEARATYIRSVELCQDLAEKFPFVPLYSETLVVTRHELTKVQESTGELTDRQAERNRRQEIEAVTRLTSDFPTNSTFSFHLALCHRDLAMFLAAHDRPGDAIAAHIHGAQLLESLIHDHPHHAHYRAVLAKAELDFGELLVDRRQRVDGERFCRLAIEVFSKLVEEFPANATYVRDLDDCRRRITTVLQERNPQIDTGGAPDKTK
jgi:serine/threonine protein kinase/tetratricopeptide (TPR) repeat protein